MTIYEAFVYEWTNATTGKKYIGYHKGTPDDGYVCSSKLMMEDYCKDTSSFHRRILAFGTKEEMVELESEILKGLNAKDSNIYYNLHNGEGKILIDSHSEKTKKKMRLSKLGVPLSEEHKKRIREGMLGYKKSDSHIENHKKTLIGRKHSESHKSKISEGLKEAWKSGRKHQNSK